jgi:hypothetical protein
VSPEERAFRRAAERYRKAEAELAMRRAELREAMKRARPDVKLETMADVLSVTRQRVAQMLKETRDG